MNFDIMNILLQPGSISEAAENLRKDLVMATLQSFLKTNDEKCTYEKSAIHINDSPTIGDNACNVFRRIIPLRLP
jgi:hypothetical protein